MALWRVNLEFLVEDSTGRESADVARNVEKICLDVLARASSSARFITTGVQHNR